MPSLPSRTSRNAADRSFGALAAGTLVQASGYAFTAGAARVPGTFAAGTVRDPGTFAGVADLVAVRITVCPPIGCGGPGTFALIAFAGGGGAPLYGGIPGNANCNAFAFGTVREADCPSSC